LKIRFDGANSCLVERWFIKQIVVDRIVRRHSKAVAGEAVLASVNLVTDMLLPYTLVKFIVGDVVL